MHTDTSTYSEQRISHHECGLWKQKVNSTFISNYRDKAVLMQQGPTCGTQLVRAAPVPGGVTGPRELPHAGAVLGLPQKQDYWSCSSCCVAEREAGWGKEGWGQPRDPCWPYLDGCREQMDTPLTWCDTLLKLQQPLKASQPPSHCSSHVLTLHLARPPAEGTEG